MRRICAPLTLALALLAAALAPAVPAAAKEPAHGWTAAIDINCQDQSFTPCLAFDLESEKGVYVLNPDGTGRALLTASVGLPGHRDTFDATIDITGWSIAPSAPYAGLIPNGSDFYVQGTLTVAGIGVVPFGVGIGRLFVDASGDTGVPFVGHPGLVRITTLYPPLSFSSGPVAVPKDVTLDFLITPKPAR